MLTTTAPEAWATRFPHVLTAADVGRSMAAGGYWTKDAIVAAGDRCTYAVYKGLLKCDQCHKDGFPDELTLSATTDKDTYGFSIVCEKCDPGAGTNPWDFPDDQYGAESKVSTAPLWGAPVGPGVAWVPPCPNGHFDFLEIGPNKGGLILSSWRGKNGGAVALDADYCMFFASNWETHWEDPAKLFPGTAGKLMPALPVEESDPLPPMASLPWIDFSAPEANVIKYAELAARLITEGSTVQIGCIGGHGRTGTFLALVLLRLGVVTTGIEALTFVRTKYCSHAIESKAQEKAIDEYAQRVHGQAIAADGGTQ